MATAIKPIIDKRLDREVIHDDCGRVIPTDMQDTEEQIALKKKLYVQFVNEFGFYNAFGKAQVSVQFVKDQLVEDLDWADQVYIGIMKNIERGFLHGTSIIDKEDIPASQKGATANLLKAIIEAAEDLYGGMIPQFNRESKGKPNGNTYNLNILVMNEETKKLIENAGARTRVAVE